MALQFHQSPTGPCVLSVLILLVVLVLSAAWDTRAPFSGCLLALAWRGPSLMQLQIWDHLWEHCWSDRAAMSKVSGLRTFSSPSDDLAEAQLLSTLQLLFDGDDDLRKGTLWKGRALRANLVALDLAEAQLLSTLQLLFDGDDDLRKGTLWKGRALRANLVALDLAEAQLLSTLQLLFDRYYDLSRSRGRSWWRFGNLRWVATPRVHDFEDPRAL